MSKHLFPSFNAKENFIVKLSSSKTKNFLFRAAGSLFLALALNGSPLNAAAATNADDAAAPNVQAPSLPAATAAHSLESSAQKLDNLEEVSCDVLGQTFNILLDNAIEPPSPQKVWQFVLEGANEFFKEHNLESKWLSEYKADSTNLERWQALQNITSLYRQAVKRCPELASDPKFTVCLAQAITDSAEDTYTVFASLDEYDDLNNYLSGDYSGSLGVVLTPNRDSQGHSHFVVAALAPDSPALKAGLRQGDELIAIDDKPLAKLNPQQCLQLMRGPNGSQVSLTYVTSLMRKMERTDSRKLLLTRAEVHFPAAWGQILYLDAQGHFSAKNLDLKATSDAEAEDEETVSQSTANPSVTAQPTSERISSNFAEKASPFTIGLLRVDMFNGSTNIEAERALIALEKAGCQGYILDLRGNPGGYTNAARDLCSKFLPEHSLIASLVDKNGQSEKTIYTYRNNHPAKPMAVLIDGQTASAAEITAGALRAHKAAFLVGSASFGKNSSQKIYNFEFPPGETSSCKVTYTHYRTPDNLDLGKSGLIPEYVIQAPFGLRYRPLQDKQLKKAFELLQKELTKQK